MASTRRHRRRRVPLSVAMILLLILMACLAVAGGASRAEVSGQAIVRFVAATVAAIICFMRGWPREGMPRVPLLLLGAAIALLLLQLIPLPPMIWTALPGRDAFLPAATITGSVQPWRPIAISPDGAWNALFSLLIPGSMLLLVAALDTRERSFLPIILLGLAGCSAVVAVAQLSSGGLNNPFINETIGVASGFFANPNHQALCLSIGIVAVGTWAITPSGQAPWRLAVAGAVAVWFLLMILASGSRTGLILGGMAMIAMGLMLRRAIRGQMMRLPTRMRLAVIVALIAVAAGLVLATIVAGRAVSLDRLLHLSTGEDMRSRAWPTLLNMVTTYMPVGSGFGGFDPLFQMHEPDALLKPTRFNHAHNDYIEVVLEGGVAAILLVSAALGWIFSRTLKAWRQYPADPAARFGSAALILIVCASAFDYPARTPIIMATLMIAAFLVAPRPGVDPLRVETDRV